MTCEDYRASLADLLGGEIEAARRDALDAHAAVCDECRALTADIQRIARAAATLERHAPPRDTWPKLAQRLAAEPGLPQTAAFRRTARSSVSAGHGIRQWAWLATAAMLAMAVGLSLVLLKRGLDRGSGHATVAGNAGRSDLVESVESELQLAAGHYEKAIAGLEQVASQGDAPLDAEVMATLRQSLAVIDKAIGDSRRAVRAEPESQLAQESLFDAFRRKVLLLQDTIALMNEMRKGNQAGAARIAEGPNKS